MKVMKATFQEIWDAPDESCCLRCSQPASRVWTATRFAIDASKERHGLLKIVIGVYRCTTCRVYFRSNPKYIKPRYLYTNKIINAAIAAAIEDKMPISRIPHRLERDFGIRPAESVVRGWIEKAAKDIVEYDVLPVAVKEFSGILCIDEAYSGKLAILLAVDPKRNDRLVGFSLSDKGIDKEHVKKFLEKLKNTGIMPDQLVTDGSALYPEVVKEVWPRVNHQLCLFHATKRLTELAKKAIRDLKKLVPKQPHATGGYATKDDVVATLKLYRDGLSLRQIAKRVGVSRNSVKAWIKNPQLVASRYDINIESSIIPVSENKENTNKNIRNPLINLPDGWSSWDQVNNVTAALKKLAFQISSRHLTTNEDSRECYNNCVESPIGSGIKPIRAFLEDWYDMFTEAATAAAKWQSMRNKSLEESCSRFKTFQSQMSDEMFEKLSTIFKDEEFEATSNGAERFARKVKRIQKSRYRLRTPTSMRDFMLLERVLHEEALKHEDMEHSNPFRKFF